jgi:type IX secretion system PorP/SprF family membrane protein
MKKLFGTLVLAVVGCSLNAQQQFQISQYQTNPYMLNPAASGMYDYVDITLSFRQQWVGFTNAPRTMYASGHSQLKFKRHKQYNPSLRTGGITPFQQPKVSTGKIKHAVGGYIMLDQYGAFSQFNATASYALHIPLTHWVELAGGVSAQFSQYQFDENKVDLLDPVDNNYFNFLGGGMNEGYMNMNAGLQLYSEKLRIGYASTELLKTLVNFGGNVTDFDLKIHHFFTGQYQFGISENINLTPSVVIRYMKAAPIWIGGSLILTYNRQFWGGFSYRHGDAVSAMVGANISKRFKFAYSYDFTVSKLRTYNKGGHEIVLGLMLGRK